MRNSNILCIFQVFAAIVLLQPPVFAQNIPAETCLLKANVSNLPAGKVYLQNIIGYQEHVVDSAYVSQFGDFSFNNTRNPNGKPLSAGLYRVILGQTKSAIYYNKPPQSFTFILSKTPVILKTDFNAPTDSMTVLSGMENQVYYEYLAQRKLSNQKLQLLDNLMLNYPDECKSVEQHAQKNDFCFLKSVQQKFNAEQASFQVYVNKLVQLHPTLFVSKIARAELYPFVDGQKTPIERQAILRNGLFKTTDFTDTLLLYSDVLPSKIITYLSLFRNQKFDEHEQTEAFIQGSDQLINLAKSGEKRVSEFVLTYLLEGFNQIKQDAVIKYLTDKYVIRNSCFADDQVIQEIVRKTQHFKPIKPGSLSPDISLTNGIAIENTSFTATGNNASMQYFRSIKKLSDIHSKFTLVFFWASWCPHCAETIPDLKSFYSNMNAKQSDFLEIVAVSLDTDTVRWTSAVENNQLKWFNYCEFKKWESPSAIAFNIRATPTFFLLDKDKKLIAQAETVDQINNLFLKNQ
jgi:thiol-disulfide isomerase/thioredoxin